MNKEERINRYGAAAYEKLLEQNSAWKAANPDKVKAHNQEHGRKGGKHYERTLKYNSTGLPHERYLVRLKHWGEYHLYQHAVGPQGHTQIHHEWIPGTADFRGIALVDAGAHRHGIIKVIEVLEGEITLFTEKEIK